MKHRRLEEIFATGELVAHRNDPTALLPILNTN
jgi:hypothetical protein